MADSDTPDCKALILGCAGTRLTADEIALLAGERPWGMILFARNIAEADQIADLTARFRDLVGRSDAPVFIDQEGGRVQRIRPPLARRYPPARPLGALHALDADAGIDAARMMGRLIAADLMPLGINVDCAPVLDIATPFTHEAIGDRAFDQRVEAVIALGRAMAEGLVEGGVLPVVKHMPGHGRARVDSHKALPVVDAPLAELERVDFAPFAALSHLPMAMTAHIVYAAIDPDNPATTSSMLIEQVIRGTIGFDGLLMSDDLSMHALSGDFAQRAARCLSAGCDIVLHCNGSMDEMTDVCAAVPPLSGASLARAKRALAYTVDAEPQEGSDFADMNAQFEQLLARVTNVAAAPRIGAV